MRSEELHKWGGGGHRSGRRSSAGSAGAMQPLGSQKRIGEYVVLGKIGSGSYATVWKGSHVVTGDPVAIKGYNLERLRLKHIVESLDSEIAIMKMFDHVNIVKLISVHRTSRHIYLVIEYCANGDLSSHLRHGPLSESRARHLLRQLARGLSFLHERNMLHRDLKPQNLLLSDNATVLKIADFGFARYMPSESLQATVCGTPLYMAPEVLRNEKYDIKADLWSTGALLYEMVVGVTPYTGQNQVDLLRNIENKPVTFPSSRVLSEECKSLILGLLHRDPAVRLSTQELCAHPFLFGDESKEAVPRPSTAGPVALVDDATSSPFALSSSGAKNIGQRTAVSRPATPVLSVDVAETCKTARVICEIADGFDDDKGIALSLYCKAIRLMVSSRLAIRNMAQPAVQLDDDLSQRIDVLSKRVALLRDDLCPDAVPLRAEQVLYEKGLQMARDASVAELMGDSARSASLFRRAHRLFALMGQECTVEEDAHVLRDIAIAIRSRMSGHPPATGTLVSYHSTANV
ncbi:hypothetical protein PBRA_003309 [Plasmodiophora brassicae]|uniref:Protein kinase domain-containing protein n=1 Tax=Plasmodiophora brassicae TaxID=37360 RepID=A0A0G4J881_PLABS|nr:hypothetical protein PBRA_003309 [Plasmodiophora brassicae]